MFVLNFKHSAFILHVDYLLYQVVFLRDSKNFVKSYIRVQANKSNIQEVETGDRSYIQIILPGKVPFVKTSMLLLRKHESIYNRFCLR